MTPTQRTLKWYREQGYVIESVTRTIQFKDKKTGRTITVTNDLYGFADYQAFGRGEVVLIQHTTGANYTARDKKIIENENAKAWIENGDVPPEGQIMNIELIAWRKLKRTGRWEPRIKRYGKGDFE